MSETIDAGGRSAELINAPQGRRIATTGSRNQSWSLSRLGLCTV